MSLTDLITNLILTLKKPKRMKKLLSLTALAALITLATLSGCKKEDPSFNGDFTHLSTELLESAIGVDSALIVDKLAKDGFAKNEYDDYVNDSFGIYYCDLEYENGKLKRIFGIQDHKTAQELKSMYMSENSKLVSRNFPWFKGIAYTHKEGESPSLALCEKNPTAFQQLFSKTDYASTRGYYSNTTIDVQIEYCNYGKPIDIIDFSITAEKHYSDSGIYQQASSECKK